MLYATPHLLAGRRFRDYPPAERSPPLGTRHRAYRRGADPQIDRAIELNPAFEAFLGQEKTEFTSIGDGYDQLARIMNSGQSSDVTEVGQD